MTLPDLAATLNAALASHRVGALAAAKAGYDAVLAGAPDNHDALYLRGMIHLVEGELDQGEALTRRALAIRPDFPEAMGNLGRIAIARGKRDAAIALWLRAVQLKPNDDALRLELGRALCEAHRYPEAIANQIPAVLKRPDDGAALLVLGNALHGQGQLDAAMATYRHGAAATPDDADLQHNLGLTLFERADPVAAIAQYHRALALRPDDHTILNNLGVALRGQGKLDDAIGCYRRALAIRPDDAMTLNNLGVASTERRDLDTAIDCYRRASARDPAAADPHYNLALTLLLRADNAADWAAGWREMEWRWQTKSFQKQQQSFEVPQWCGEPLGDGVLLLHDEQGLGDTIQFARYVPQAARRAKIVLQVQRPLLRLLTGLAGVQQIVARGEKLPPATAHLPLLSLPHVLGTGPDEIPTPAFYLQAPADRTAHWRQRVHTLPGLRVGLVWAGNPRLGGASYDQADRRRSLPLAQLAALARPGVSLLSLQKGAAARQVSETPDLAITDWTGALTDMAETAALVTALDLVISVDTAVAHLAGALGRPIWLLNRFDNDWRWLLSRDDSPWYASLRQFRQTVAGDWAGPVARVRAALAALIATSNGASQNRAE